MDYMTDKYPALLELLEKRFALAERYLALTEKQKDAIAADSESALLASLEERAALAKEIEAADKEAEKALGEYKPKRGTEKADEMLERTRALFIQCLTLDRKNMSGIKEAMEKSTGDSRELQKRREGINKYAQSDYIFTPSVLDKHR